MSVAVGQAVRLKSGGPKMTIADIDTYDYVTKARCRWFVGSRQVEGFFEPETLEPVDDAPGLTVNHARRSGR